MNIRKLRTKKFYNIGPRVQAGAPACHPTLTEDNAEELTYLYINYILYTLMCNCVVLHVLMRKSIVYAALTFVANVLFNNELKTLFCFMVSDKVKRVYNI